MLREFRIIGIIDDLFIAVVPDIMDIIFDIFEESVKCQRQISIKNSEN